MGITAPQLAFAYFGKAPAGKIDQTITITNPSTDTAVVPRISYLALDETGQPLDGVTVTTLYGSDQGLVVAPANYEVFDILQFTGSGTVRVDDVRAEVESSDVYADDGMVYPEIDYVDANRESVPSPFQARAVQVVNPGFQDYAVSLIGISWDIPDPGRPQQARRSTPIAEQVPVGASDTTYVSVPPAMRGQFDSIKAYISVR